MLLRLACRCAHGVMLGAPRSVGGAAALAVAGVATTAVQLHSSAVEVQLP